MQIRSHVYHILSVLTVLTLVWSSVPAFAAPVPRRAKEEIEEPVPPVEAPLSPPGGVTGSDAVPATDVPSPNSLELQRIEAATSSEVPFGPRLVITDTTAGAWSVYAADVDHDGDIDVLSASASDNKIAWYENDGSSPPAFTSHTVTTAALSARSVYATDIDDDGDVDLLSASIGDDKIAWYESDGGSPPAFTDHTIATTANGAYSVYAADVDGDGDVDVLSASYYDNKIAWYENNGGSPPIFVGRVITTTAHAATSVFAADVEGDGDVDILSASVDDDKIAWYENDGGSPPLFSSHVITTSASGAQSVYAADVDADGDTDVLSGSRYDDKVAWYENDGGSPPTFTGHVITTAFDEPISVYAADVDGDGDTDVLAAADMGAQIVWCENDGASPPRFVDHVIGSTVSRAQSVHGADVDGDGDLDALAASAGSDNRISWFRNETIHRSAAFPFQAQAVITDGAHYAYSVYATDVDSDGDTDVLSASFGDDEIAWYENTGGSPPTFTSHLITTTADWAMEVYAADVDGDGDTDILSASANDDKVAWYENDGGSSPIFASHIITLSADYAYSVYAADVDGDGDIDALSASVNDDKIAWYENDGASPPAFTSHVITTTADSARSVHAADVDGDGDMDVLSASYGDNKIAWYESDGGSPPHFTSHIITINANGANSVYAADVDGDGDVDVLSASMWDDKIAWYENDGASPPSFTSHNVTTSADHTGSVYAADVDDDGDIDILSASDGNETVAWYENDGGSSPIFASHVITDSATYVKCVFAADLDGDGDADVLSSARESGKIAWYENRGGQFALSTTDTAPTTINGGQQDDVLRITAAHRGRAGDTDVELATLELKFEEVAGDPLTTAEANELIENLHVYYDDGSGDFEPGTDVLVATVSTLSLMTGTQTITFADGDLNVQVAFGSPITYFVVPELTPDAPSRPVRQFQVTHVTEASSMAEDSDHDLLLVLEFTPNVASSIVSAAAVGPDDVTIAGPTAGSVDTAYTFTATVSPVSTTFPITYVWQVTDLPWVTHTNRLSITDAVSFTWPTADTHLVGVTAENQNGAASDVHVIVISDPSTCVEVTGVTLTVTNTTTIYTGTVVYFGADVAPDDATKPYTYQLTMDSAPGSAMTAAADPLTFSDTFATPGAHTVEIGVWNCAMTAVVTDSVTVVVSEPTACVELSSVTIGGEATGYPGVYTFTTTYLPVGSTLPITYIWDDGTTTATSTRPLDAGTHTLAVTATNCSGAQVTDTHTVVIDAPPVCPNPLESVGIRGPISGITGTLYIFSGVITPSDATSPVTYTWSPMPAMGQETGDATYSWDVPGVYTLTLWAGNCGGTVLVSNTHEVSVSGSSVPDTAPPAAITDLVATTGSSLGTIDLSWTAPGDDGITGTASTYVVRYSTAPIDEGNWDGSTDVAGEPTPGPAGGNEHMTVSGLTPGETYFFAIKTQDEVPNTSDVSNSPSAAAKAESPPAEISPLIVDLRDHGPDPKTAIALVGQPVVWINNGTQDHTITEGEQFFYLYLPLVLRQGAGASRRVSATAPPSEEIPLFDSGTLAPGERFTYTFATTGTFGYYSARSVGKVVGTIVVVPTGEVVSRIVNMGTAAVLSTTSGARLEIGHSVLLTDTTAYIAEIPITVLTDTTGTPVGTLHDIHIAHFDSVISGHVTITLPYDPGRLPAGASEDNVRTYYHNGIRWISVGGQVDSVHHATVVTMTHLTNMQNQSPCDNPFDLTAAEEDAFDAAADYLGKLAEARDVFDAFTTSDGQHIFDVGYDNAQWLAEQTLCDLAQMSLADIPIDKTPTEVVDEMVALGQRVVTVRGDTATGEDIEKIAKSLATALSLCALAVGPGGLLVEEIAWHIIVDTALASLISVRVNRVHVGEMERIADEMDTWLQAADDVGESNMEVTAANAMTSGYTCDTYNYQATGDFYHYQALGKWVYYDRETRTSYHEPSDAHANLYQDAGDVYFVLGLESLLPFRESAYLLGPIDYTDRIYLLIEYQDTENRTRANTMSFPNSGLETAVYMEGICVTGRVELPAIRPGSEVEVKYIFVNKEHIDTRLPGTSPSRRGIQYPIPIDKPLCFGECNDPPNEPSNPTPDDFAMGQGLNVDLSWTGGDPDGDQVTYTVYFAEENPTPYVPICGGITVETCDPGTLKPDTAYYWRVVAEDEHGLTEEGPVWRFSTELPAVTMDQVFTTDHRGNLKDSFRPGEAIELWLRATNNTLETIPVTYDWLTTNAVGTRVDDLSWDNWSVSMEPGMDDWHLSRGISYDAPYGPYTYRATVSYPSGSSHLETTFVVEGDPLPVVIDAIHTTDYRGNIKDSFRPGEAIRLGFDITNYSNETALVTLNWLTHDPNGESVPYLSWENWERSLAPGGTAYYLTRGVDLNAAAGTYNYEASAVTASGASVRERTFEVAGDPIEENLLSALTCKDVQGGKPVDETDAFTTNDTYVYVWTAWEGLPSGNHTVRWDWHKPGGALFDSFSYNFDSDEAFWRVWSWKPVSSLGNNFGEWRVDVYLDGAPAPAGSTTFTLQATGIRTKGEPLPLGFDGGGAAEGRSPVAEPSVGPVRENDHSTDRIPHRP